VADLTDVMFLVPHQPPGFRIFAGGELARLPQPLAAALIGQRVATFVDVHSAGSPQPSQRAVSSAQRAYAPAAMRAPRILHRAVGIPQFSDRELRGRQ
jgi:hypothetical protein